MGTDMGTDILTVVFIGGSKDEAALCVSREYNGEIFVLKNVLGEQADIPYHLLTEQAAKVETSDNGHAD